jgi:hypothetical protein
MASSHDTDPTKADAVEGGESASDRSPIQDTLPLGEADASEDEVDMNAALARWIKKPIPPPADWVKEGHKSDGEMFVKYQGRGRLAPGTATPEPMEAVIVKAELAKAGASAPTPPVYEDQSSGSARLKSAASAPIPSTPPVYEEEPPGPSRLEPTFRVERSHSTSLVVAAVAVGLAILGGVIWMLSPSPRAAEDLPAASARPVVPVAPGTPVASPSVAIPVAVTSTPAATLSASPAITSRPSLPPAVSVSRPAPEVRTTPRAHADAVPVEENSAPASARTKQDPL